MVLGALLWSLCVLDSARAAITVYGQIPLGQTTSTSSTAGASATVLAAYNTTVLNPPAIPSPALPTTFTVALESANTSVSGLSIPQSGSFYGFSIEMSVLTQIRESLYCLQGVHISSLSSSWQELVRNHDFIFISPLTQ